LQSEKRKFQKKCSSFEKWAIFSRGNPLSSVPLPSARWSTPGDGVVDQDDEAAERDGRERGERRRDGRQAPRLLLRQGPARRALRLRPPARGEPARRVSARARRLLRHGRLGLRGAAAGGDAGGARRQARRLLRRRAQARRRLVPPGDRVRAGRPARLRGGLQRGQGGRVRVAQRRGGGAVPPDAAVRGRQPHWHAQRDPGVQGGGVQQDCHVILALHAL
jgi:hypothetical protein